MRRGKSFVYISKRSSNANIAAAATTTLLLDNVRRQSDDTHIKSIFDRFSDFPEMIETTVFPTTCEDTDRQYVCITLQIMPTNRYPETKPDFKLKAPRGLDDHGVTVIERAITQKLEESLGQPVVFDLIDLIREHLTESNLPTGQCVICLYGFQDGDEFTKTACYHYLHSHCLGIWLTNARRNFDEEQAKLPAWQRNEAKPFQSCCPVCRETIDIDVESLKLAQPPQELESAPEFCLTAELKALQLEMSKLFMKQKEKGGIIDAAAEEKMLIAIDPEGAANEQKRRQEVAINRTNSQPNSSNATVPQKAAKTKQQPAEDDNEDDEDDDDRRRRGGRRQDRYHKGKRERYHGRYRNQESTR